MLWPTSCCRKQHSAQCQFRSDSHIDGILTCCSRYTPPDRYDWLLNIVYTARRRNVACHMHCTDTWETCWWACIWDKPTAKVFRSCCPMEWRSSTPRRCLTPPPPAAAGCTTVIDNNFSLRIHFQTCKVKTFNSGYFHELFVSDWAGFMI